jgi:hypothetical protein
MVCKLSFLLCLIALAPGAAFAGVIPSSGPETGGAVNPGQPFASNFDNDIFEANWGLPGLSASRPAPNGPTIGSFQNFEGNVFEDRTRAILGQAGSCVSGAAGSTAFCALSYASPRSAGPIGDSILLLTPPSGDYLTGSDPFSINSSFAGAEPRRASFSSDVPTVVPEPGSLILLGTGILGIAAVLRIRRRRP